MARKTPPKPGLSARGRQAQADRQAREAQALRENLRKRSAQRRGRAAADTPQDPADPGPGPTGKA